MAKKTFSKVPSLFSSAPAFPSLMAITEPFRKARFGGMLAPLVWSVHLCSSLDRGVTGSMLQSGVKKGMICMSAYLQEEHLGFLWVK